MNSSLAAELVLFGYDDFGFYVDDGREGEHGYGLAAAVLVELALATRLDVTDGKLHLLDPAPIGDPEADHLLHWIATGGENGRRSPRWWIDQMRMDTNGGRGDLRRRLLDHLAERGVLRLDQHKVLRVLPVRHYFLLDSTIKSEVRLRLDRAVHGNESDARTVALLLLLWHPCGYSLDDFANVKRRTFEARVEQLTNGPWAGGATKAVQSILDAAEKASAQARSSSGPY